MKNRALHKIALSFYRSAGRIEPVCDWLRGLEEADRREIGLDLMRVQWRWPVAMLLCRAMGQGLWEVRSTLANNRIARVLFCRHAGSLIALHGFIKKSATTPDDDLALARKRQKEIGK